MILRIDTTQPLTDTDRAVLTALLGEKTPTPKHAPTPAPSFLDNLQAAAKPRSATAEARLPVTQQAGVRATESVPEPDNEQPPSTTG